ncbi:TetR family transcriptional regulator [Murinocardiopsis flavida]|uniref:TetR family transcriptional regulator n=1 Tax=Murinocardiopsis flavida TaxID=645275 RepID=A0A2P8DS66_9ACTN|nr:TetR/AcrR family transcriptional regulator [Murinocardiopsis flavida]PSL00064.1 TetR family transcriptional regulator [Murinocardiopsis flavida]
MVKRAGVDEFKLIGLLWRESPVSPRSGISTQSITGLAVGLADEEGIDAVTIRRLAEEAGVSAMALYPHIGGRAELVELMLDQVAGATYEAVTIPGSADWRARITAIAEANWANCRAHPWITDLAAGRPVPGPGASAKYDAELGALDGIGLTDIEMEHTLTALLCLVQGTARAALAAQGSRQSGEEHDADWWSNIEPVLTAAIGDAAKFPTAARVSRVLGAETGKANDPEGAYRRGIGLFLDGIARQLDPVKE